MREKIDISSDISLLISQLRRLAASRLGKKLQLNELVFVEPELAQIIIDIDNAVKLYADKETRETWEALKHRVVRKAALIGIRKLSETSQLFIAGAEAKKETEYEEDEWD